jgi:hypothetical protein
MNDAEKTNLIAREVMGHSVIAGTDPVVWWDPVTERYGGGYYDPVHNDSQAREAIEAWCKKKRIRWACEMVNGRYQVWFRSFCLPLNCYLDGARYDDETFATAICDALIAAVQAEQS